MQISRIIIEEKSGRSVQLVLKINNEEYVVKRVTFNDVEEFNLNFNADRIVNDYVMSLEKITFDPLHIVDTKDDF